MTKKNVLFAIIMAVVICFIAGCASTCIVKAMEQTDDEVAIVTIPEAAFETIFAEEIAGELISDPYVDEMASVVFAEAGTPDEEVDESTLEVFFGTHFVEADFFEDMDELHLLAGFIQYEGGEAFERMLVAQIVVDTLNQETSPHDTLAELLTDRRYFGILEKHWNNICAEIADENLLIAEAVLEMSKGDNDITIYDGYTYADIFEIRDMQGFNESDFEFSFTTKHYVFYQR